MMMTETGNYWQGCTTVTANVRGQQLEPGSGGRADAGKQMGAAICAQCCVFCSLVPREEI